MGNTLNIGGFVTRYGAIKRKEKRKSCDYGELFYKEEQLFDRNEFDRLFLKTDFETYTDELWESGISITAAWKNFLLKESKNHLNNALNELAEMLLFLMDNKNIEIKISSPKSYIKITNEKSVDFLKEMVSKFLQEKEEVEVTKEFLQEKIKKYARNKRGKGSPVKNYHINFMIIEIFLRLHHKPTNADFRLIYEYCKFFNLISDEITSKPHQYIKSIYQNSKEMIDFCSLKKWGWN